MIIHCFLWFYYCIDSELMDDESNASTSSTSSYVNDKIKDDISEVCMCILFLRVIKK